MVMRHGKAEDGSGKTFYNRIKSPGQSWTKLRDEAKRNGTFEHDVGRGVRSTSHSMTSVDDNAE